MDNNLRNQLNKMVKEFKSEETTENIREHKNSRRIHSDVQTMLNLKSKYARLKKSNPEQFKQIAIKQCNFLYTNFTNIFHRLYKDELDLNILFQMIQVLEKIENGTLDQHEGSYMVGDILKKMFIDSALKKEAKDEKAKKKKRKKEIKKLPTKKISWSDFKKSSTYQNNISS
tara:strand:- start:215 stop:730 length:516 start_codon:yes stop_codon:yes gene_type:complete